MSEWNVRRRPINTDAAKVNEYVTAYWKATDEVGGPTGWATDAHTYIVISNFIHDGATDGDIREYLDAWIRETRKIHVRLCTAPNTCLGGVQKDKN